MKKQFLLFTLLLITGFSYGQIESGLLFGLTKGTTAEINAISGMEEGQMLYNTDTHEIYVYTGSSWVKTANSNWLQNGNTSSSGSFLGTTNDVGMDIKSNNISLLQFGRRQTLGLTQSYPDYNDNDQYLTYVKGNNGTSALQFQADAADFYKPMFFTDSNGNFRLKGSAASTDFFELGSAGVSNAGIMEFIIGDDGAEPFIFKRYDYRDQLTKELFRIQGSADSQNALPRVGINTGQLANSTLEVNGSVATAITSPSSSLTLDETHHTLIITSNSSVTLPAANSCEGRTYIIKNTYGSAVSISNYLDNTGTNANKIPSNSAIQIQSDGSSWHSISGSDTSASASTMVSTDADNIITVGTDGGAYLKINQGARWTNTDTSTNLNNDNTLVPIFGNEDYNDDNNLYQVTGNELMVKEAGRYDIRSNLALYAVKDKTSVTFRIEINGSPVGAVGATGFLKESNKLLPSIAINEILQLNTNDVITINADRVGKSGNVYLSGTGTSNFIINKIK
ncbi:hypothetical protein HPE56_11795 [Maribacter sp. ANRC-HE7]|uniref:C1q domain-containing protein n=1 Tax=Maribacter aquimaris TaxID=2737171 RepID=A0ABR7V0W0_9FLAO|nr:hypothetical protein [Maribacter aquimaris]MBD0778479.1 hypothetical protein [Maribacter aquimaris]